MSTATTPSVRPSVVENPVTRGLSVVIAADRPHDAEVIALTLEHLGCDVAATALGPAAVDLAFLAQPEVVILAPTTPGWEGVPATLADRAGWRKPFVIAVGHGARAVPGVHAAADRPVSPAVLTGLVRRLRELLAGVRGFDPAI